MHVATYKDFINVRVYVLVLVHVLDTFTLDTFAPILCMSALLSTRMCIW